MCCGEEIKCDICNSNCDNKMSVEEIDKELEKVNKQLKQLEEEKE
jgi:hypothetical protein